MRDYNELFDWLEKFRLTIYIDNFVKGGFDMTSVLGITAEVKKATCFCSSNLEFRQVIFTTLRCVVSYLIIKKSCLPNSLIETVYVLKVVLESKVLTTGWGKLELLAVRDRLNSKFVGKIQVLSCVGYTWCYPILYWVDSSLNCLGTTNVSGGGFFHFPLCFSIS